MWLGLDIPEEECGLRGFSLFAIAEIVGALPAAVIRAEIFMGLHIGNHGENVLGLSQVFVFGLLCSLNVLRTDSIWWAAAFNASWDWTEEASTERLAMAIGLRPLVSVSTAWSLNDQRGTAGTESSLLVFVVLGRLLATELALLRWKSPGGLTNARLTAQEGI